MLELIKDESFDIQNTKDYILSIQVSLDGFSFLIVLPDEKRILAYKNSTISISSANLLARHLKEWLDGEELLKHDFKNIQTQILSEKFVLIPEKLFEKEKQRTITSTLFDKKIHNHFLKNNIENLDAKLIFPVSKDVVATLHNFFNKNIEIIHPVAQLLKSESESNFKYQSVIIPTNKFFYLIVRQDDQILVANSYHIEHKNDLVYNLLNAFQQLNIARNETGLFIAGTKTQNVEIRAILNSYFIYIDNLNTKGYISNPDIIYNSLPLFLTVN